MIKKRQKFIDEIKKSGKFRKGLLNIVNEIDRQEFFDPALGDKVYAMEPVLIGKGEVSDEPVTMLRMIQYLDLNRNSRVLEIGTGSGYSTSILASLAGEVVTIEFHEELALKAKRVLSRQGFNNIKSFAGDGTLYENIIGTGFFDAIIIFAGCVLRPLNILNNLTADGQAVFPMGTPAQQMIAIYRNIKSGESVDTLNKIKFHDLCVFSSIRGVYGWEDQVEGYFKDDFNDKTGKN